MKLNDVPRESATIALAEVERKTISGRVLAVARRSDGALVLAREIERGTVGTDGKRSRDHGTEKILKPTAALADFADAIAGGLVE